MLKRCLKKALGGYVNAQLILMCITFAVLFAAFLILRIKYAFLMAALTAFAVSYTHLSVWCICWNLSRSWRLNSYFAGCRKTYRQGWGRIAVSYTHLYLNLIFPNVKIISTNSASETFEQIYRIGENDVVVAISFPRYSRRTINALKYAHEKKSRCV